MAGTEGVKPGWVRVNFNYFLSEPVVQFLLDAVHFVASHGWKLLPHYRFDLATGQWTPRRGRPSEAMRLTDLSYRSGKLEFRSRHSTEPEWVLAGYLGDAERIVEQAVSEFKTAPPLLDDPAIDPAIDRLRWFPLPGEVLCELQGRESQTHCGFHLGAT
jgi:hypothetical protein